LASSLTKRQQKKTLDACLLTDEEFKAGPESWKKLPGGIDFGKIEDWIYELDGGNEGEDEGEDEGDESNTKRPKHDHSQHNHKGNKSEKKSKESEKKSKESEKESKESEKESKESKVSSKTSS